MRKLYLLLTFLVCTVGMLAQDVANTLDRHNFLYAGQSKRMRTVWSYAAPEGTEIHTIQPVGRNHVVFVQNGRPAKAVVMEIPSKKVVREFVLPTQEKGSVHGQFRNARLTSRGTLLVLCQRIHVCRP